MEKYKCYMCGKVMAGYSTPSAGLEGNFSVIMATIGNCCQNCGEAFCVDENKKHLKESLWHGFTKSICPKCGQPFGPGITITSTPFSNKENAEEQPLGSSKIVSPSSFKFAHLVDPLTNEQIIDEVLFDTVHDKNFILTDRRLIYKTHETSNSIFGLLFNEPVRYWNYSLSHISNVNAQAGWGKTTFSFDADFGTTRIPYAWNFDKGNDIIRFADNLRIMAETKAVTFNLPEGEELLFNYEGPIQVLHISPFGAFKNIHNSHLGHFAITNQRLLLYEIDHLTGGGKNDGYGAPHLVYCSLSWDKIKNFQISSSFLTNSIDLILNMRPPVWRIPGLCFLKDEDLVYSFDTESPIISEQAQAILPQLADLQKINMLEVLDEENTQLFLNGESELPIWKLIEPILERLPVTIKKK